MDGQAQVLANSVSKETASEALASFDEAFELHHRIVYRVAYARLGDAALAEDVTQEVFLKLYRNLGKVPRDEGLRAWLLRVTINEARDLSRRRRRASAREEAFAQRASERYAFDCEKRLEVDEVRRALERVREPARSCLLLQQQGLSYREIAQILSLNERSIGSLIARGRREFLRLYGKLRGRR